MTNVILLRRTFHLVTAAGAALMVFHGQPAHAQVLQWLRRQIGGSNAGGNANQSNNPQQYSSPTPGPNQPVVGYNPNYYQPVQDPINPLTGMNKAMVQTMFIAPPDYRPNGNVPMNQRPNPSKATSLAQQSEQMIQQGQFMQAEQTLWQAYLNNHSDPEVLNDLGVVCDRLNHLQSALEYYKMAATVAPNFAQAYYNAGLDEYSYAGPIPGMPLLVQALRLDGTHSDWWYWVGNDKVINGMYDDGMYDYNQAIRLNPSYAAAYMWRGVLELRRSQDSAAHADLQKARALDPSLGQQISAEYSAIMAARRQIRAMEEAQARAAAAARRDQQTAQNFYRTHQRSIQAVVSQGPRYYDEVYNQAVQEGESPSEAESRENEAREQYNKDVALQSAWENSDYAMMDKISSGQASSDDIQYYNASESPTAAVGSGGESESSSGDGGGEPETAAPEPMDSGGGDD